MTKLLAAILLFFASYNLYGQSIENIQLEYFGDSLLIHFDIEDPISNIYDLEVFSSHDEFSSPLVLVSGDIKSVTSGGNKSICWKIAEELEEFNGSIAVEIRGFLVVNPVKFLDLPGKIKRGRNSTINWYGGKPASGYELRIEKNGVVIHRAPIDNARSYNYDVPSKARPGKYKIELISNDPLGGKIEDEITIARRLPLGIQLSPIGGALVAGIIILLQPEPPKPLPEPPDPSDIK